LRLPRKRMILSSTTACAALRPRSRSARATALSSAWVRRVLRCRASRKPRSRSVAILILLTPPPGTRMAWAIRCAGVSELILRKNPTRFGFQTTPLSGGNLRKSIFMMQAAENRFGNHLMITWNLMSVRPDSRHSHQRIRNPRSQTRVRSVLVVVSYPFRKKSSQMPFVQRDHEIQALSS
jgi:hypothetical protein